MMEQGKLYYGDRFVALSYHSTGYESGAMTCIEPEDFPIGVSGYPAACVNRSTQIDPSNVMSRWTTIAAQPASCDVSVDLFWADDSHTTLKAISKVRFLRDIDGCRYVWSVALLADGLSNPKWEQNNAYAEVVAREYYNLQGLRVERPESGIQRRWGNMPAACPYRPGKTLQHGNNNDVD